jgi:predicted Fe-Mo cluster-binding NifX family protein
MQGESDMRIAITANGTDLDAQASPVFGRCPAYVLVDTETMQFEGLENPAIGTPSGAGIQAAQFVIQCGGQAIVTGNVGPNAYAVFQASGVPVYSFGGGTVREAVDAYLNGRLEPVGGANVPAYSGMGSSMGGGMGRGRGWGRGMGVGRGRWRAAVPTTPASGVAPDEAWDVASSTALGEEKAALRKTAEELREQLDRIEERLAQLEDEQ